MSVEPIKVQMDTTAGKIVLELDPSKAPITVDNFIRYVKAGFYEGTIFHRVIENFMIQGGGMDENMRDRPTHEPIKNEANNGLSNLAMTVSMARTNDPDSATAQFFINLVDNQRLNYSSPQNQGYAVFGKVIEGEDVVKKIGKSKTGVRGYFTDVPTETVTIQKMSIISGK